MGTEFMDAEYAKKEVKKDITEDFDYVKILEETEAIQECLEKTLEETTKMKVDSAIANIELASDIDGTELHSKLDCTAKSVQDFTEELSAMEVEPKS